MSDIGPRDFVAAVRDAPACYGFQAVVAESVYQVAHLLEMNAMCSACGCRPGFGIVLIGDEPQFPGSSAWCPCGFRPLYRPKADLVERLLRAPEGIAA